MKKAGKIISIKIKENMVSEGDKQVVGSKIGYVRYEEVKEAQKCI